MPNWSEEEFAKLESILSKITAELEPLSGKEVLVLRSGAGEVALWLGRRKR